MIKNILGKYGLEWIETVDNDVKQLVENVWNFLKLFKMVQYGQKRVEIVERVVKYNSK